MQFQLTHKKDGAKLNELLLEDYSLESSKQTVVLSPLKLKKEPSIQSPLRKLSKMGKKMGKMKIATDMVDVDISERSQKQSQLPRLDELEQFHIAQPVSKDFVFDKYNIWDLTYSLINAKINKSLLFVLFVAQVFIRYLSILSLVYVTIKTFSQQWQWVFILVFTNTLYFICIVKISLKPAQSQSQFILKNSFNSLQENQALDYFRVISPRKLFTSILRGLVPPQFSCLYIKNSEKKAEIYAMINYIYSSIEAVIYYPFFAIYMFVIIKNNKQFDSTIIFYLSFALICLSEIAFMTFSIYLVIFGCKKKGYIKPNKEK